MKLKRPLVLLGVAFSVPGCIGGPASVVYVMSPSMDSQQTQTTDANMPALQVETASLPSFLDNSDILIRRGPYVLDASSTGHWGERLSLGITHALRADLTRKLPGYRVSLERSETPTSLRLQLEVDSFDVYPDGHCVLAASWSIVQKSGTTPPAFGRGVFTAPASPAQHAGDEELVNAMAGAIAQLADAIVGSM
jgi:uncharacterized lipoprotein YmbA